MEQKLEKELVEQAKHDREALARLYDHYYKPIYNYIFRRCGDIYLAQDITADCFLAVLKNIEHFSWQHDYSFTAWIYKIATNALNLYYRKNKKLSFFSNSEMDLFYQNDPSDNEILAVERELSHTQEFARVQEIIVTLDEKYQTIIHLRFFENKSYEEISYITGLKINTLKSHLARALDKITKKISATR